MNHLFWGLALFSTLVWGTVPPLGILLLYYRRVRAAPPLKGLVLLFGVGILSGLLALSIEALFLLLLKLMGEIVAIDYPLLLPSFEGLMLRQIGVIAPIEEGCKLAGVALPLMGVIRRYQRMPAQASTVFLATFAVAMGFAAQENVLAIWHNSNVIVNRTIGVPMHAIFSAPWGLALGFALCRMTPHSKSSVDRIARPYKLTMGAWITACLVHAGSNCWVYLTQAPKMSWLVYPLLAWWIWLWWQTEKMLARSQDEPTPQLITATRPTGRVQEYVIASIILGLGGTAINSLRDIGNSIMLLWELRAMLDQSTAWFVGEEFLRALILGAIALYLFKHLRDRANPPNPTN